MDNKTLFDSFAKNLRKFAKGGYRFENGKALRKGTQEEAVQGFTTGLEQGHIHGHFEIPTGVGKTATFISLIDNYLKAAKKTSSDKRVLIVVPSTDLVIQTAKAFAKFMPEIAKTIEADDDNNEAIDWEKSEIGAQYSKLKHADKKPKVLITTYQSLVKDNANTTYPPNEYGFIVYDEGHYITGEQFSRSVAKFEDSIQLAVTATREYSEDKNVQKYLAHEYFRLPIKDAIERKDLCGVHPILVQTDFTIDQRKFDSFIQQNNGRPLTEKQKQDLFNQKTRNQAIVETYLLGKDNETGESYFGQTGLVFAAGIKHCADLKNQLNQTIKGEKYKPLKTWLDSQGIAIAAEIHSKTKGEELTINGNKRFYSKDEIKELHREGKILLLISDQELKQGTDFPADSMIMDVVDRYSWVDTKQRYGRGYRLDPENPDKICKVFNFMDKNTREIYGDSPECMPIYCAETLEGVQFQKKPSRLAFKRFKEPPPKLEEALKNSNFELITDIDRVAQISIDYKKIRDDGLYPKKTTDHLTLGYEITNALVIASQNSTYLKWRNSTEDAIKDGKTITVGGYPVQRMQPKKGSPPLCLHKDAMPALAKLLGIQFKQGLPDKTEEYLSLRTELPAALNIDRQNSTYLQWLREREDVLETVHVGKYPVVKMLTSGKAIFCLHKDAAPILAKELDIKLTPDLRQKTENDVTLSRDIPAILGIDPQNAKYREWRGSIEAAIEQGKTPKVGGYPILRMKSLKGKALYLHKGAVPLLAEQLGLELKAELPDKTKNHLTLGSELPMALHINRNNDVYVEWVRKVEKLIEEGKGLKIGKHPVQKMKSGSTSPYCLHEDAVPQLSQQLGIQLTDDLPLRTEQHVTLAREIPRILKIEQLNPRYVEWLNKVKNLIQKGKCPMVGKYPVQRMKSRGQLPLCLHIDAIPILGEQLGVTLPEKTRQFLSLKTEVPPAMNISIRNPAYISWRLSAESAIEKGEAPKVGDYDVKKMRSGTRSTICIDKNAIPVLRELLEEQAMEAVQGDAHDNESSHADKIKAGKIKPATVTAQKSRRGSWSKSVEEE